MVIMSFNEITVIALKKTIIWCKLKGYIEWNSYYHIFFFKVCMIVARDIDRIRQTMGNQPPEHLQRDWRCSLLICFRVPAHSPMPASFIFTGSLSHYIRFRFLANQGCCQGGYRWELFFRLSPSWQPGPARRGVQHAQAVFIYFAVTLQCV